MIKDEELIGILTDLGLCFLQAKIYLSLVTLGKSEIKAVSKASNVARTDVYRLMPSLEKLGLAEKVISKPTTYKATGLRDGISILLQRKRNDYSELESKTGLLLNSLNDEVLQAPKDQSSQFIITSEKTLFQKRFEKSFSRAQTVDIVFPTEGFKLSPLPMFEYLSAACKRGAKIRIITSREDRFMAKRKGRLRKNPFVAVKYASLPIKFASVIFDKKEFNACVSSDGSDVPSLYTDNTEIVEMANTLFEFLWSNAEQGELHWNSQIEAGIK